MSAMSAITLNHACLLRLGCYKDKDRESVKTDETWACPACASLIQKKSPGITLLKMTHFE